MNAILLETEKSDILREVDKRLKSSWRFTYNSITGANTATLVMCESADTTSWMYVEVALFREGSRYIPKISYNAPTNEADTVAILAHAAMILGAVSVSDIADAVLNRSQSL